MLHFSALNSTLNKTNVFLVAFLLINGICLQTTFAQDQTGTKDQASSTSDAMQVNDAIKPFLDRSEDVRKAEDSWLAGDWTIDWSDEFEGDGKIDEKKWHFFLPDEPQRNKTAYLTKTHAFRKDNVLVMEAVTVDGFAEMSQLRSYNDMRGAWDVDFPNEDDFLLDPTKGPLYVESSVRFDKASPAFRAWWAIWLLSPNADWMKDAEGNPRIYGHYNDDADSGTEVDIFEYVPDVNSNGFNIAIYKSQPSNDNPDKGIRPGDRMFTCENAKDKYGIQLDDGKYHKIGFYYSVDRYAIYIDGKQIWTFTDEEKPGWITKLARNGILMTWEADNLGPWGQAREKNADGSPKTFASENTNAKVLIDYVRVHRLKK